ncbi:uncharacterized protein BKA55DRAFT_536575 [Fusarium redolens]|uniref:Uncharacterized protein n=1 Tax=Fusarium redolens TaxID=48865 RepID=A0A9P9KIX3_FUSRE|nr:uncharacterized protein BKA55DRAFT_536575 [Fusarium redolens]KAH7258855.1 hypothetical protein BKA55DRAFT_536575 [Fusarium redolens]
MAHGATSKSHGNIEPGKQEEDSGLCQHVACYTVVRCYQWNSLIVDFIILDHGNIHGESTAATVKLAWNRSSKEIFNQDGGVGSDSQLVSAELTMERELSSAMRLRVDSICFTLFSKVLDRDSRVATGFCAMTDWIEHLGSKRRIVPLLHLEMIQGHFRQIHQYSIRLALRDVPSLIEFYITGVTILKGIPTWETGLISVS